MARCVLGRFGVLYVFIWSIVWLTQCTLMTAAGHHGGHHGGAARHGGGWKRQQPRWHPKKQQQHWHQQKRASNDYWRRYSKPHSKQWWAPHHATAKHANYNKQWHQQQQHSHQQQQRWQQQQKHWQQEHWKQEHWKQQHWHQQKRATTDYWRRHSKPHSKQWWEPRFMTTYRPVHPEASCPTHHYQEPCRGRQGCLWCYNRFSFWPGSNGVCIASKNKWELPSWVYVCTYHW